MSLSSFKHRADLFTRVLTMLIILTGLSSSGAPARAISMMPQCRFDPDGYFYVKGGSPRGFQELDYIQLQGPHNSSQHTNLESQLSAKNGRSYRLASLGEFRTHSSGNGIVFEFTTEIIKGVQYQFSGKFRSICVLANTERDPEKVVAVGRLLKFKKGKQKGAADVELTYSKSPRPISR